MDINTNKKILITTLLLAMMMAFCLVFTGCGGSEEMTDDDIDYVMNEEGMEGEAPADAKSIAKSKTLNQDVDNFIGSWSATSEEAKNLYGNLDITINEGGTFDANVTGETLHGSWTKTQDGISYTCDLMKGTMYYGDHGKLVIEDDENGGVKLVLNKTN